jgi:hypothetical protein
MIEGSGSEAGPYFVLKDPDPDPGGPKTYGSGSGSATLPIICEHFFSEAFMKCFQATVQETPPAPQENT